MTAERRIACRAVFLDAGGVIVLPDRNLVADGLRALGIVHGFAGSSMVLTVEDSSPVLLELVAARCSLHRNECREALRILVIQLAGLAAQRATEEDDTTMAEEVAEMFAARSAEEQQEHAVRFHRAIARGAGNPVLAAFAEALMVSFAEDCREKIEPPPDLRKSAQVHNAIYKAIRRRRPDEAESAMEEHGYLAVADELSRAQPQKDAESDRKNRALFRI